jgi:3-hexulose-6-phosphate synthase
MKLQLALDTLTIEECEKLLRETKDYVDIAEIGTPFIIQEGMKPVSVFKEKFPTIEILADTKIMDAGYYEAEIAFKAGADIVTVLGVSNDQTIKSAIQAAKDYDGKIYIDMIECKNLQKRVQEIEAFGADYIGVHTAFDVQNTGKKPLDELIEINQVLTTSGTAIAGGVKLATINGIAEQNPDIIVVGGAICNAKDRMGIAREIKSHMK